MPAPLTARRVELLRPDPTKRREVPDGALPGLYLVVQPSGVKSWATRYRHAGVPRKLTLGAYPLLSLAAAREKAREALRAVAEGRDPAAERTAATAPTERARHTFGAVAADYVKRHAKAHHRTWQETERLLVKADLAAWRDRDIREIGRRDVLDMLDAVLERGAGVQANRLLTRLKPFFVWAVERGVLTSSPVEGLRPPSPETARDRVLSDDELRAVWRAAERIGYPFGAAVQLLVLTGCRRSEVLEAEWSEFDVDGRTWTILRERSKTNAAHVVPLSDPALQLVTSLPRIAESGTGPARYLFTTTGRSPFSGVSKVLERLNERAAEEMPRPDEEALRPWRLHDLRRTFASGCARLGVPVHVVEKALNHTSGTFGGIVGVYQRHEYLDERRRALEIWAERLVDLIEAADS